MAPIKTPKIVIGFPTHSFGVGSLHDVAVLDDDPLLIGTPANSFIWNHATMAFAAFQLQAGTGNVNANTHPDWSFGYEDFISMTQTILAAARAKFPDEDIYLVPLGRFGSTMSKGDLDNVLNERTVFLVDNSSGTHTDVVFLTGPAGAAKLFRGGPVEAKIAGITGLTPSINATHASLVVETAPGPTQGLQVRVPIATTGTGTGGTVNVAPGNWDPAETDEAAIWPDWAASMTAAYEALWAADFTPDPRGVFVCLGVNDVTYAIEGVYEPAMLRFIAAMRELMNMQVGVDVPIVWLLPMLTQVLLQTPAFVQGLEVTRTALKAAANSDTRMAVINVDQASVEIDGPIAMTADGIHPTYVGFQMLAKALVEGLDQIDKQG